jgi:hypothetical protein
VITNDVSDYINLLVRIAHSICNHPYSHVYGSFILFIKTVEKIRRQKVKEEEEEKLVALLKVEGG